MADDKHFSDVAGDNWAWYQRARDTGHDDYVTFAKRCDRFYRGGGEQWEHADRKRLEEEGRPALEVNMILSTVNALLGEQSNQRADIIVKPRRNADDDDAAVLTQLIDAILDDNKFPWVEGQVFADGLIQDRGFFDIRIDTTDNIYGDIKIRAENPLNILLSPEASEYDPATWDAVAKTKWMTLDEIEVLYGKEHRKSIEGHGYTGSAYGVDSIQYEEDTFGEAETYYDTYGEKRLARVRVIERQWRKLGRVTEFVDPETGEAKQIPDGMAPERAEQIAEATGVLLVKKVKPRIRWTVSVDNYLIHDDWSPYNYFTIVPFFPYFRRGKPCGVVRNLISPQEQLNKIESQMLHVVNTTANSGWLIETGSLANMTLEEVESRGAETGLVLAYNRGYTPPEKIQPNSVPTGLDLAAAKSANNIKAISGVYDALLGSESPEVSGVALDRKLSRGLVQAQVPFDHLNYSRHLLAVRIIDLIQNFYTEPRMYNLVDLSDPEQKSQPLLVNQPQPDGSVFNDITKGNFNVVISTAPARDTYLETQFAEALQLREVGVMIPDDVIIESSNMARKREIAQRVREMQGTAEKSQEELEFEQHMLELQVRSLEAAVAEQEGKAQKTAAESSLSQAKAQELGGRLQLDTTVEIGRLQLEIDKLKASMVKMASDANNKLDLADRHIKAKQDLTQFTTASKSFIDQLKMQNQLLVAQINAKKQQTAASAKRRPSA